jgi:hypothetical protein
MMDYSFPCDGVIYADVPYNYRDDAAIYGSNGSDVHC